MRIVFMATGEIALPSLRWLLDQTDHEVVGVFTQPDKPVGRKQILTPPEVKVVATEANIPVFQPERLRGNEDAIGSLNKLEPDLNVVMAYGQILPDAVIEAPNIASVNLHASILPRHRGASPIQAAIREGDEESGITLMHIAPELDAGDMILCEAIALSAEETAQSLHDRLAKLGPIVLERGLPLLASNPIPADPQNENLVTYAGKLEREHGRIDWKQSAERIERLLRAYHPWPGTFTEIEVDGEMRKLKLFPPASLGPPTDGAPGEVIASNRSLQVGCGTGSLFFTSDVQLEGRKRLPIEDLLRGLPIAPGTILGEG